MDILYNFCSLFVSKFPFNFKEKYKFSVTWIYKKRDTNCYLYILWIMLGILCKNDSEEIIAKSLELTLGK